MTLRSAPLLLSFLLASMVNASPATIDNDADCDISNLPAATLLLPYFEVDFTAPAGNGETTIFTITNVSHLSQIARVTLWTDLAYPVFSFNVFLTGYDVQSINLFDVFTHGRIGGDAQHTVRLSGTDNPLIDQETCASAPARLDETVLARMQAAFTLGRGAPACARVGKPHTNAVGYATIDVVGSCSTSMPIDPAYFSEDIRWDNVLIGDYLQVNGAEDFAQGGSMVPIRAIPEGGHPRARREQPRYEVTSPRTFYDRYQNHARPRFDARQPLPSVFAARWIDGSAAGFETFYKIWREGIDTAGTCSEYLKNWTMGIIETVRFDEDENPQSFTPDCGGASLCIMPPAPLSATQLIDVGSSDVFPRNPDDAVAGWMYFNLGFDDGRSPSEQQAWIIASMRAEGRYSVDVEAQALGNGCSPLQRYTSEHENPIGPVPNDIGNDASCDISPSPAATLLLPYFEVDVSSPAGAGQTTIFTVTNASQLPQVARVTFWTDLAYPVFAFNIYLTGYDVQSINLYDVFALGLLAPDRGTGSRYSPVGSLSGTSKTAEYDNPLLDEEDCYSAAPVTLSPGLLAWIWPPFTTGRLPRHGTSPGCAFVGGTHTNAIGYATIDVVGLCSISLPTDPTYFTEDIRFDNVLLGDYMQIDSGGDFAQSNAMVHIRAIPEGGHPRTRAADPAFDVSFPSTFYGAYQSPDRPRADARQPLPSVFAARWIAGGPNGFETSYKIWRQAKKANAACDDSIRMNDMPFVEVVRFDEDENPRTYADDCDLFVPCRPSEPLLRAAILEDASDGYLFPENSDAAVAGWMYINLDDAEGDEKTAQAWVITSMRAEDRFSVDIDASALGNGCSAPVAKTIANDGRGRIGPLPNKRQ